METESENNQQKIPNEGYNANMYIKTHGSVSCGPRSRCATPVSDYNCAQFLRIHSSVKLQQNQMIFAVEMLANVITSHSKFQLNQVRRFQDINH